MPLLVVSFCHYLVTAEVSWRDDDFNASKFIKAIKGEPFRGYARVPINGARRRLDSTNTAAAHHWFAKWAARKVTDQFGSTPVTLIAVPSSDTVETAQQRSRAGELAHLMVDHLPSATVTDVLRWKKPMRSSRSGGTRSPATLLRSLTALPWKWRPKQPHILIDDVWTTGGHLRACCALLRQHGVIVSLAVCAGYTVHDPPEDPFDVEVMELADF